MCLFCVKCTLESSCLFCGKGKLESYDERWVGFGGMRILDLIFDDLLLKLKSGWKFLMGVDCIWFMVALGHWLYDFYSATTARQVVLISKTMASCRLLVHSSKLDGMNILCPCISFSSIVTSRQQSTILYPASSDSSAYRWFMAISLHFFRHWPRLLQAITSEWVDHPPNGWSFFPFMVASHLLWSSWRLLVYAFVPGNIGSLPTLLLLLLPQALPTTLDKFDAECIDTWFHSHSSTCPLCRLPVNVEDRALPVCEGTGTEIEEFVFRPCRARCSSDYRTDAVNAQVSQRSIFEVNSPLFVSNDTRLLIC